MRICYINLIALLCTAFPGVGGELPGTRKVTVRPNPYLRVVYHVKANDSDYFQGPYSLYFEHNLIAKGEFQNNLQHGKWARFYASGEKHIDANYKNGVKHGTWKYYYKDGNLSAEINFDRGKKAGTWRGYFPDGEPSAIFNYCHDSLCGEHVLYHTNGTIAELRDISYNDNGKEVKVQRFYDNGKPYEVYTIKNDTVYGTYKKFHPSGIPWEQFEYRNGKLVSVGNMKNETGVNLVKGGFRDGAGELKRYHYDGTLYSVESYNDGLKNGKSKYHLDNTLRVEGFYVDGEKLGTWRYYSKFGKLLTERNFFGKNEMIYEVNYGFTTEERVEGERQKGLKEGMWKHINNYGEVFKEIEYSLGYKHGVFRRFDRNVILEKGGYFYGEKVGTWQSYNNSGKVVYEQDFNKSVSFDTSFVNPQTVGEVFSTQSRYSFTKQKEEPRFPGEHVIGEDYLYGNIKYPQQASKYDVRGAVLSYFVIDEFGWVQEVKIQRGIGFGCDQQVRNLQYVLPVYKPGLRHGIPAKQLVEKEFVFGEVDQ